jgi:hypothetical protein
MTSLPRLNIPARSCIVFLSTVVMISTICHAQQLHPQEAAKACQSASGKWLEQYGECENVGQQWCNANKGRFEECGSACRHNPEPAVPCTMQCIPYCAFVANAPQLKAGSSAPLDQAWSILEEGAANKSTDKRVATIRVLQLIPGDAKAVTIAEHGLSDRDPEVRSAAATSLGVMRSTSSIALLIAVTRKDTEGAVVMAAANSLIQLGNKNGYNAYYAVLTGQHKSGDNLIAGEQQEPNQLLRNPSQMEAMAFEQGIGFVPFGGIGYQAFETIHASEAKGSILKVIAIKALAMDPDPGTGIALVAATVDKDWLIRAVAFDALARRGDSSLLPNLSSGLKDEKQEVQLTAAAAVIHLSTMAKNAAK